MEEAAIRDAAADRMAEEADRYAKYGIAVAKAVASLREEARAWRGEA